jgi:hypothetical protein
VQKKDVIANEIVGFGVSDLYFFPPLSYFEWTKRVECVIGLGTFIDWNGRNGPLFSMF